MAEDLSKQPFLLIFKGPVDDSMKTLQRIKAAFVGELELPIEEVQRILATTPSIVQGAAEQDLLKPALKILEHAGAKVEIAAGEEEKATPPASAEFESDNQKVYELSLNSDTALENAVEEQSNAKTYKLDLDEPVDPALTGSEGDGIREVTIPPEDAPAEQPLFSMLTDEEVAAFSAQKTGTANPQSQAAGKNAATAGQPEPDGLSFELAAAPAEAKAAPVAAESGSKEAPKPAPAPASGTSGSGELDFNLEINLHDEAKAGETPAPAPEPDEDFSIKFEDDKSKHTAVQEPASEAHTPPAAPASAATLQAAEEGETAVAVEKPLATRAIVARRLADAARPPQKKAAAQKQTAPLPEEPEDDFENPGFEQAEQPEDDESAAGAEQGFEEGQKPEADSEQNEEPSHFHQDKKHKKGFFLPLDYIIPILIGSGILGTANWYYFNGLPAARQDDQAAVQEMLAAEETPPTEMEEPQTLADLEQRFEGLDENSERRVFVRITGMEKNLQKVTLAVVRPPAPEPSKEDIVARRLQPPWVGQIEVKELAIVTQAEGGFRATGPAFAYVNDNGKRVRLAGTAELDLSWSGDSQSVLHIRASARSSGLAPEQSNFSWIRRMPNGALQFTFTTELDASLKAKKTDQASGTENK